MEMEMVGETESFSFFFFLGLLSLSFLVGKSSLEVEELSRWSLNTEVYTWLFFGEYCVSMMCGPPKYVSIDWIQHQEDPLISFK